MTRRGLIKGRPLAPRSRRGVAALEFALVAPVMAIMFFGTLDICRAYIAWQEVNNAAEAVVQAAEKLAITPGSPTTQLNATQMQAAMSVIYVEMPGLDYGRGRGLLGRGTFAITLSEVDFAPLCATTTLTAKCPAQTPQTLWSTWLTEGGPYINLAPPLDTPFTRACGPLIPSSQFPNNKNQLLYMITPTATLTGGVNVTLVPQLVADVRFVFKPTFHVFVSQITFWASATLPAPLGGTSQEVSFDPSAGTANVVPCAAPPQPA
jgi:hypothetical protein